MSKKDGKKKLEEIKKITFVLSDKFLNDQKSQKYGGITRWLEYLSMQKARREKAFIILSYLISST
ncbi:hypothetical protein DFR79_101212 [Halanaerobium saccharolyticum]|uniref:Uncharacterized protein n=1 Tax=Halanaerobium saccharolyticum TaxID=43595 RepID=A0A4R6M1V7_9FIRM|nr:hypothetical protein [Halanaerobium saccharolyticum]TDO95211.1 hypothetical protein DFR79_101212 [Halanaerobium saccharolyticum]